MQITILKTSLRSEEVFQSMKDDPYQSLVSFSPMTFNVKGSTMTLSSVVPFIESGGRLAIECSDDRYVFVSTMVSEADGRLFFPTGIGNKVDVDKFIESSEKTLAAQKK